MAKADVEAVKPNATWKHPPSAEKYSQEQLADLVAYIRWAGAKDKTKISPTTCSRSDFPRDGRYD